MVHRVYAMKAPPLLSTERPNDGMIQQLHFGPETPLGICQAGIEGNQSVAELAH